MSQLRQLSIHFGLLFFAACGSSSHDIMSNVPLGSSLSDLEHHLKRAPGSYGEVVEWIPTGKKEGFSNEFGQFQRNALGPYDAWHATPEERNRFSGQINFYHHGTTSSDVNSLIYINGKLVKRDWGFLPG